MDGTSVEKDKNISNSANEEENESINAHQKEVIASQDSMICKETLEKPSALPSKQSSPSESPLSNSNNKQQSPCKRKVSGQ